jgi:hypothetical protein
MQRAVAGDPGWSVTRVALARISWLVRRQLRCVRARCGLLATARELEAHEKGALLLRQELTVPQRHQYDKDWRFHVRGGESGRRYRIRYGRCMNIDELDEAGRRVCGWCFHPAGDLVPADVVLAQKLALELFEADALKVARKR